MKIKTPTDIKFKRYHSQLLKHLRLKRLQPKTIEAYKRAIKRIYAFFNRNKPSKPRKPRNRLYFVPIPWFSWFG